MKKLSTSDRLTLWIVALVIVITFLATLRICSSVSLSPLSLMTAEEYALRTAGGFAFVAGFGAFVAIKAYQDRKP